MNANALSRVLVVEGFSQKFEVKVGVHQGSLLSPLLFIIMLEALSREFRLVFSGRTYMQCWRQGLCPSDE